MHRITPALCFTLFLAVAWAQPNRGYYRYPSIHGDQILFTAEGDLWQVSIAGGTARRLTTHPGEETRAVFSPDGKTIAFSADYEGPTEVYTMPASGGLPSRRTFEGGTALVAGWTADGKVLYTTRRYSTLPDSQLATIDAQNRIRLVPLSQAAQGSFDATGHTLFFTRLPFQGSYAKRYQGGTAQKLWKYSGGQEAIPLTVDYAGTSKDAMWWNRRVYFLSDRDGTMNIWSMDENGKNLKQHTHHQGWDAQTPSLSEGRIVYKLGADLHLYDIAAGADKLVPIEAVSDFDHLREHWVKQPNEYGTAVHISHDGNQLVLTSRGEIFVAPAKQGRLVDATARKPGRFRDARLMPDGKSLIAISTESGEAEIWKLPANGVGKGEQLTTDGHVLRWEPAPSPDGKWIAHQDKENQLWILDPAARTQKKIFTAEFGGNSFPQFSTVRWSPDSRWLSFATSAADEFEQIYLYSIEKGTLTPLTTDRYNSSSASWSPDGKWIYFLSDRALKTVVFSPWGPRQPDPFFDHTNRIYQLALHKGERSPFEPADELHPNKPEEAAKPGDTEKKTEAGKPVDSGAKKTEPVKVEIDLDGIASRISEVPAPAGNYGALTATSKRLCWMNSDREDQEKTALQCLEIANKGEKPETIIDGIRGYELSGDSKKLLIRKKDDFYIVDASVKADALKTPKTLEEAKVDLKDWTFTIVPTEEFHEMFLDAWRLHRDYFYDRHMNGIDWKAIREKYLPLVDRVRDRQELSDLIAQMVSELSALHTFVGGGDIRRGPDQIQIAALGARLERDASAGGYLVQHVYRSDPDRPDRLAPLARPGVDVSDGDVILAVNGRDALSAADIGELLRAHASKQVLLRIRPAGKGETRDVIVKPITVQQEGDLRYHEWEYTRRMRVDEEAGGQVGYVHLRAMGANDINQWAEQFYPVFNRQGLIIDVRHNGGGNIDSWILGKLMRKAWFYWQPRIGKPTWNMQYAFRGHMVLLCDEWTGSDGEAFSEGFRQLGLGKLIGTRTWGGEIWLTGSNVLSDRGIATAAELGVYGPDGKWLIEGHGVDPDMVIDNLPHATFEGKDAQLEAAILYLKDLIKEKPITVPPPPPYPDKTVRAATKTVAVKTAGTR
ncbi:MAG TPA: S41 family peptidase [Bryobacteraceae bacterium]|nr:S41 family peptidase [Bryobacteraceae bacterium]